jgi:ADP-ribosylglycohydrolase
VPADFLSQLRPNDAVLRWKLAALPDLLQARLAPAEAAALLGNGVRAVDAVPLALYSFLRAAPDFEEVIVQTALAGGDVDTLCAMSGALAGALVGEPGLPRRWLARVEGRGRVEALAEGIYDALDGYS